jgi:hypothetical protein
MWASVHLRSAPVPPTTARPALDDLAELITPAHVATAPPAWSRHGRRLTTGPRLFLGRPPAPPTSTGCSDPRRHVATALQLAVCGAPLRHTEAARRDHPPPSTSTCAPTPTPTPTWPPPAGRSVDRRASTSDLWLFVRPPAPPPINRTEPTWPPPASWFPLRASAHTKAAPVRTEAARPALDQPHRAPVATAHQLGVCEAAVHHSLS